MSSTKRSGKTKLHWAVIENVPIQPFQSYDDINAKDELGRSALHWAAALDNTDWAQYLMESLKVDWFLQDNDGRTPLHEAAINDNNNIAKLFLGNNDVLDKINTGDNFHRTALQWAVQNSSLTVEHELIENHASVFTTDIPISKALERAVRNGPKSVEDCMCDELRKNWNKQSREALIWAVDKNEFDIATRLVDCEEWTSLPWGTLLQYAVEKDDEYIIQQLLDKKEMLNARDGPSRTPPLVYAASEGLAVIVQRLLRQESIEVDVCDKCGKTPLIHAAIKGHKDILSQLIDKGADINAKDHSLSTPLLYAVKSGREELIRQLLQRNALVEPYYVQGAEAEGKHKIAELLKGHLKPQDHPPQQDRPYRDSFELNLTPLERLQRERQQQEWLPNSISTIYYNSTIGTYL